MPVPMRAPRPSAYRLVVATIKANLYPLAAVLLVLLLVWAWGTGEDGDLGFAALCAAVAVAGFAIGAWTRVGGWSL
jgi:hypothetical protein